MEFRRGVVAGVAAYVVWGGSPIFWNAIKTIPPTEVLAWRVVFALILLALLILVTGRVASMRAALANRRTVAIGMTSGLLLTMNWALFIWAVTNGHIVHVSLGYYINPLMSVALAVVVLRESLSRGTKVAVTIAGLGVLVMTVAAGELPWISLTLAVTFALYGLLKKQVDAAPPFEGLLIEVMTAVVPLGLYLGWIVAQGNSVVLQTHEEWALLPFTGVITIVPLVLFGMSAQRIPLATVGMLQYLAPTIQLAIGVSLYGELISSGELFGFASVWLGLGIFAADGLRTARASQAA